MRELKFRVWYYDQKKFDNNVEIGDFKRYSFPLHWCCVQQYTGIKDRNGVEVYEGDIVAEKLTEEMAANGDSATVGVVYFAAGTFMIDGDGPLYDRTHSLTPDILEDFVVVGNKFTNPELLK